MFSRDEYYMKRALQLAALGLGSVQPNPMVGAVIVHQDRIIGEGWHQKYGGSHAEVNAIKQVKDQNLLQEATLYVTLEPCSHFGKTPPCVDLIIERKIPRVVVANIDPNICVNGDGIKKMQNANIEVVTHVLAAECAFLNRRFFTFHTKKRPYIILKWAETANGYMDIDRQFSVGSQTYWITNETLRLLNHKWRSEEDAVLIGCKTFLNDAPQLTNRLYAGKNPKRCLMMRQFDPRDILMRNFGFELLPENVDEALSLLYQAKIESIIVEGGKTTLERFIRCDAWDEMRVLVGDVAWEKGTLAPQKPPYCASEMTVADNRVLTFYKSKI